MNLHDWRRRFIFGSIVGFGSLSLPTLGCSVTPPNYASPQRLQQLGTRAYLGRTEAEVRTAVVMGLKLQGYELITERPLVRTAPKLFEISSMKTGNINDHWGQTYGVFLAWDIEIQEQHGVVNVLARPRANVNGRATNNFTDDWAFETYGQLFETIHSSFPQSVPITSPSPQASSVKPIPLASTQL